VSPFLRTFFDFFALQPHHLGANTVLALSCFVLFCECYAGLWPSVDLWRRLFYLRPQTADLVMLVCGAALIYLRAGISFQKIPIIDSTKKWQKTFFYVNNVDPAVDRVNLPPFSNTIPVTKQN
jgi:hypothetical protein